MRNRLLALVAGALAALFALAVVVAAVPDRRALAVQIYAFGLCAIVLLWLLGRTGAMRGDRSAFDEARRVEADDDSPLADLAKIEREVTLGVGNAYDLHYRLRPRIRAIVQSRLADRRGIDLDRQPDAAEAAVTPAVWEVVRPDLLPPRDRHGPGLGTPRLREVMDGLDRI